MDACGWNGSLLACTDEFSALPSRRLPMLLGVDRVRFSQLIHLWEVEQLCCICHRNRRRFWCLPTAQAARFISNPLKVQKPIFLPSEISELAATRLLLIFAYYRFEQKVDDEQENGNDNDENHGKEAEVHVVVPAQDLILALLLFDRSLRRSNPLTNVFLQ